MSTRSTKRKRLKRTPRLDIRAPVILGLAVIVLFFGGGVGGAALAPIDKGVGLSGKFIVETKVKPVQHERGGIVSAIHAGEGDQVEAGDELITFDTTALTEQLAALDSQAAATQRQLDLARSEAATMADLLARKLTQKSRVLALERQVAQIEKEVAATQARIAVARQELRRAVVRAPVSGRVLSVGVNGVGVVAEPGSTLMEIVPASDKLVIEARLSPDSVENVTHGMPARVWLPALGWRDQRPVDARLSWVSPDSLTDERSGARYFSARIVVNEDAIADLRARTRLLPGMRAEVMLVTGKRTLLDQIVDPLLRNMNRAFRQ